MYDNNCQEELSSLTNLLKQQHKMIEKKEVVQISEFLKIIPSLISANVPGLIVNLILLNLNFIKQETLIHLTVNREFVRNLIDDILAEIKVAEKKPEYEELCFTKIVQSFETKFYRLEQLEANKSSLELLFCLLNLLGIINHKHECKVQLKKLKKLILLKRLQPIKTNFGGGLGGGYGEVYDPIAWHGKHQDEKLYKEMIKKAYQKILDL